MPQRVSEEALAGEADRREALPINWIFHIAHCGSTLLSRLIDPPGAALVLREPPPLRQLGLAKAGGPVTPEWQPRLRLARAMAARRFEPGPATVVKANVPVNFMLPDLLGEDPEDRAILLYFALEPYLLAILRSAEHRGWIDRVTRLLQPALTAATGLGAEAGTVERAAALWLAQMQAFDAVLRRFPLARSLDAEVLFASPGAVAKEVAAHFGRPEAGIEEQARLLSSSYSKDPSRSFDETARRTAREESRSRLKDELDAARAWVQRSEAAAQAAHIAGPAAGR